MVGRKLNLQLFARDTMSIVDYLESQGHDSSFEARKGVAQSLGMSNYTGTAEQNTALLRALRDGIAPSSTPKSSGGGGNPSGTTKQNTSKNDSTPQAPVQNTEPQVPSGTGSAIGGVDQSTIDKMQSSFNASSAYQDAMNYTNQLLQQLNSGRTSYTDQIKDLMGQIQSRDKFEYDVDSDMLFQQYLASSMASGKTAMQDTMGQAAALTGGYGSTYATSAANQAYNSYIQDAYNNLPEYYQLALEAYQMEGEEMYNQLVMLSDADAKEYQRLYDSWGANLSNAQQIYQNEYQAWADEVNNAFNYAGLVNSDYWNMQNYIEEQRQFDTSFAEEQAQFVARYDLNGDGIVDANDQNGGGVDYKSPSAQQLSDALKIFNEQGEDAYIDYLAKLEAAGVDIAEVDMHVDANRKVSLGEKITTGIKDTLGKMFK